MRRLGLALLLAVAGFQQVASGAIYSPDLTSVPTATDVSHYFPGVSLNMLHWDWNGTVAAWWPVCTWKMDDGTTVLSGPDGLPFVQPGNDNRFLQIIFDKPMNYLALTVKAPLGQEYMVVDYYDAGNPNQYVNYWRGTTSFEITGTSIVGAIVRTTASDAYFTDLSFGGDSIPEPAAVPEPSSLVVWSSLGVIGLIAAFRSRRKPA